MASDGEKVVASLSNTRMERLGNTEVWWSSRICHALFTGEKGSSEKCIHTYVILS